MENNGEKKPISKFLLIVDSFLLISAIGITLLIYNNVNKPVKTESKVAQVEKPVFDNLDLVAKAAFVLDISTGTVIYAKNEDAQLPLASITKLMTALTALELIPKNSHITIRKEFLVEEGDTGLRAGESWKLEDLLDFSLVVSSNDGARSIASVAGAFDLKTDDYDLGRKDFIHKMNLKAQTLGLNQTYFVNESGLDEGGTSGGYGSVKDVTTLLQYILSHNPEIVEATKYSTATLDSSSTTHKVKNTNADVGNIPGLLASKTGYTALAGGNLAVAFDPSIGRPIIAVVLGSTEKGRFKDIDTLVKASLQYTHISK